MREYNYNKEIKILLNQVLDAFGNLVVKRINESTGAEEDSVQVNLRYSPKSRTIQDIVNKNQHIQLPVMSLSIGGIAYDSSRTFNKIAGFYTDVPSATAFGKHYQPLPVILTLNLSVLSRYQNDLDQIITNLFTFFHPYIVISYTHPENGHEVRCVVQWDGNIPIQYPLDVAATAPYRITADSTFKVMGWIYRNFPNTVGKIYKIDHNFQAVNKFEDYYAMEELKTPYVSDNIVLSARPTVKQVVPYITLNGVSGNEFHIHGDMFHYLSALYVSASPAVYPNAYEIDYFADNPKLSATYPAFTGLSVENYEILGEKAVKFTLPTPQDVGHIAVIAINEAGYGNLLVDSVRETLNPYPSSMPEHLTYVEPQFPWVSGIEVVNTL